MTQTDLNPALLISSIFSRTIECCYQWQYSLGELQLAPYVISPTKARAEEKRVNLGKPW